MSGSLDRAERVALKQAILKQILAAVVTCKKEGNFPNLVAAYESLLARARNIKVNDSNTFAAEIIHVNTDFIKVKRQMLASKTLTLLEPKRFKATPPQAPKRPYNSRGTLTVKRRSTAEPPKKALVRARVGFLPGNVTPKYNSERASSRSSQAGISVTAETPAEILATTPQVLTAEEIASNYAAIKDFFAKFSGSIRLNADTSMFPMLEQHVYNEFRTMVQQLNRNFEDIKRSVLRQLDKKEARALKAATKNVSYFVGIICSKPKLPAGSWQQKMCQALSKIPGIDFSIAELDERFTEQTTKLACNRSQLLVYLIKAQYKEEQLSDVVLDEGELKNITRGQSKQVLDAITRDNVKENFRWLPPRP